MRTHTHTHTHSLQAVPTIKKFPDLTHFSPLLHINISASNGEKSELIVHYFTPTPPPKKDQPW